MTWQCRRGWAWASGRPALEIVVNVMSVMSPWRVLCIRKMNIAGIVGGKDRKTAQPLVVVVNALRI